MDDMIFRYGKMIFPPFSASVIGKRSSTFCTVFLLRFLGNQKEAGDEMTGKTLPGRNFLPGRDCVRSDKTYRPALRRKPFLFPVRYRKEDKMKKKVLMKRILTALAMAAMIPAGETWAAEFSGTEGQDDYTIFINGTFEDTYVWGDMTGDLPGYSDWRTWQYRNVSQFKNIIVNDALEVKSLKEGKGDISGTNLTITVPEDCNKTRRCVH